MPILVRAVGPVQVLELAGEFTFGGSSIARTLDLQGRPLDDMGKVLAALFEAGQRMVVLDMHDVNFIDSAGLGELVAAKKRALERGGDIRILRPATKVRTLLALTHLDQVFQVHDDEAAAVASFGSAH